MHTVQEYNDVHIVIQLTTVTAVMYYCNTLQYIRPLRHHRQVIYFTHLEYRVIIIQYRNVHFISYMLFLTVY